MGKSSVYIVLTDTGTVFTKTIKKYTKAPYNHASLSLDAELIEMYSFGRKHPKNPIYGGFVREDVFKGTYAHYPETTCAIYKLEISEREKQKIRRMIKAFEKRSKKMTYNLLGVLGISVKEAVEIDGSYFCSHFVYDVLHRSGIRFWDKLPALVEPNDFREIEQLELIYEGKLFEYPPIIKRQEANK